MEALSSNHDVSTSAIEVVLVAASESTAGSIDLIHPEGTKLLQRLLYYLQANRSLHCNNHDDDDHCDEIDNNNNNNTNSNSNTNTNTNSHHRRDEPEQQQHRQSQPQLSKHGMTLPMNAIVWFLQQYVEHQQQQQHSPPHHHHQQQQQPDHHRTVTLMQQIKPLLLYCTKLRITSQPWPTVVSAECVSSQSQQPPPHHQQQQQQQQQQRRRGEQDSSSSCVATTHSPDAQSPIVNNIKRRVNRTTTTTTLTGRMFSQYIMDLTQCTSHVFPNLHTLWLDQISGMEIARMMKHTLHCSDGNGWMMALIAAATTTTRSVIQDVNNINNTAIVNDHLRVLRIDMIMDGTTTEMNRYSSSSSSSSSNNCNRMNSTRSDVAHTSSNSPIGKQQPRTLVLQRDTNIHSTPSSSPPVAVAPPSMILAVVPSPAMTQQPLRVTTPTTTKESDDFVRKRVDNTRQRKPQNRTRQLHTLSREKDVSSLSQSTSNIHDDDADTGDHDHGHLRCDQVTFPTVTHLKCNYSLPVTDGDGIVPPFYATTFPNLQSLCLSHCRIDTTEVALRGLHQLLYLQQLDLSYNHIVSFRQAHYHLGHITTLNISYNSLQSMDGIDRLYSLQTLHVEYNQLCDLHDTASKLANLPLLKIVCIKGNPCCYEQTLPSTQVPKKNRESSVRLDVGTTTTTPTATNVVNSQRRPIYNYCVDIWSAFIERRLSTFYKTKEHRQQLTLRNVIDELIPTIDGKLPIQRQWYVLRNRVYMLVEQPFFKHHSIPNDSHVTSATIKSYTSQATTSSMRRSRRASREKLPRTITSLDNSHTYPNPAKASEIRFNSPSRWSDALLELPNPAFSVSDVIHSMRTPSAIITHSAIPPIIIQCLHDTKISQSVLSSGKDQDELLELDENIGQVYRNSIMSARNSIMSAQLDGPPVDVPSEINSALPDIPASPESPQQKLTVLVSSISESQWQDDNVSLPSGMDLTNGSPAGPKLSASDRLSKHETFQLAEKNSKYVGPKTYQNLCIRENLELYFRFFVFSSALTNSSVDTVSDDNDVGSWRFVLQRYPRIQLWPVDRATRYDTLSRRKTQLDSFNIHSIDTVDQIETFRRVWKENIVGCGKPALRRLTPSRMARYGFHGELLWSAAESSQIKPEVVVECREAICCLSDTSFYIVVDHDTVTKKPQKTSKREFPIPIPESAKFKDSKWPHALVCHSLDLLNRITIGFGFQRLILYFDDPTSTPNDLYVYILLTCNKLETIALLKVLQELTSTEANYILGPSSAPRPDVQIDNDDPMVLDSLSLAVAPDLVGVVLHYQVLQQKWKSGGRGKVRRVCVVTDSKVYLLDEDYVGDGSDTVVGNGTNGSNTVQGTGDQRNVGNCSHRLVDSAALDQIEFAEADDHTDPNSVTIVMKPLTRLTRRRNWRLLCRDNRQGAERLVEDLRKAVSLTPVDFSKSCDSID